MGLSKEQIANAIYENIMNIYVVELYTGGILTPFESSLIIGRHERNIINFYRVLNNDDEVKEVDKLINDRLDEELNNGKL